MVNLTPPLVLAVAPNGARKTKDDHPNLPITIEEITHEAVLCKEQGATLFHLHIRGKDGKHSLDASVYKDAIKAINREIGDDMIIQITTEACGIFEPKQQIATVKKVKPEAVSLAIKELVPEDDTEAEIEAANFFQWMYKEKISPQYIIYSADELRRFNELRQRGIIVGDKYFLLFVLGRYSKGQLSAPKDLLPFIQAYNEFGLEENTHWAVCAFGKEELACAQVAAAFDGHVRIGFENNLHLANGTIAQNNSELLKQFKDNIKSFNRKVANIDAARKLISI